MRAILGIVTVPMPSHTGSRSLSKSLRLIETVADGARALDEITEASGIPRSTAHRLLSTLVRERYLTHAPGTGYRLGPMLIGLGFKARDQFDLTAVARPHMVRLSRRTFEAIHLGVLEDRDIIYIEKVPGSRGLSMASYVGFRAPAQCTALGKVLIASLHESAWDDYFDPDLARTGNSVTDPDAFHVMLRSTRSAGYAEDREENEPGVRCVAVPVRDATGEVVASMSLSGATVYLTDERVREILPHVLATGVAISQELGWKAAAEGSNDE